MATVLLLALPLAWRAGAPPTPCARSASALRGGHPAAAVAAVPQVLVQRFMPMMPCAAQAEIAPGPPDCTYGPAAGLYCTYGRRVPAFSVLSPPRGPRAARVQGRQLTVRLRQPQVASAYTLTVRAK